MHTHTHTHTHGEGRRDAAADAADDDGVCVFHTSSDLAGLGGTGPAPAPIHRACICVVCVAAAPLTASPLYAFPYADTALDTARRNMMIGSFG